MCVCVLVVVSQKPFLNVRDVGFVVGLFLD